MSQFPKSGFLARAATSSAAAATRASLRGPKPGAPLPLVPSSSSSRRTSHSHPNPPPSSSAAAAASSSSSISAAAASEASAPSSPARTSAASGVHASSGSSLHATEAEPYYGPPLPGGAYTASSTAATTAAASGATSVSVAAPIPIQASASPTFVSIGVQIATSSSNVFGPSSAPASSFASALSTAAPIPRRPFNFWPHSVVTSHGGTSTPTPTASGYAAAAAAASGQTVTSPLLGGAQTQPQASTTPPPSHSSASQGSGRPSPADIFLSSLNSDFDPSLPWSAKGASTSVDWLSHSLASARIQSSVSWEGRNTPSAQSGSAGSGRNTPLTGASASKRSRTHTSPHQWRRPPPMNFDTTIGHGDNWNTSFSSNLYRAPDGTFVEGPSFSANSGGSSSQSGHKSSSSSSSSHNQQQGQQGRSPPPHPNHYPSSAPTLSSTGALLTRPPSSGANSSSNSSPFNASSSLSHATAAAASSSSASSNSALLNGNGFGSPGGVSARAFSIPPQSHTFPHSVDPQFHFEHGAYGIPKRHPLSSVQRKRRKGNDASAGRERASGGAVGFFAAAASTLVGGGSLKAEEPPAPTPAPAEPVKEAAVPTPNFTNASSNASLTNDPVSGKPAAAAAQRETAATDATAPEPHVAATVERRRPRGIRENGRIVHERLRSVQVGEDAYFLREDALGVADGVGGWASRPGADPALFSRLLMHFCSVELSRFDALSSEELAAKDGAMLQRWAHVDPVEIIHCAWHRCVRAARREGIIGSSTALVAVLRGDELRIANVGDCVLLIIRQGDLLFRSTEQQHSFNFPVQLGMMGDTVESVAEELQRRKEAKEKAAAAAAQAAADAKGEQGQAAASSDGSLSASEKADEEDADDEPIPDGVDYTIEGHGKANTAADASQPDANGAALSAADSQSNDSASSADTAGTSGDANDDDAEVEWDEPRRDAGRWSVKVEPGDVIIIGSDGLVDNLFDEDILEEVLRFAPPPPENPVPDASANGAAPAADGEAEGDGGSADQAEGDDDLASANVDRSPFGTWLPPDFSPQLVSEALCSRAKAVSEDSRALYSPFQQRAVTEGLHYVGGKLDDISVLVAVVGAHNVGTDQEGKLFVSQSLRNYPSAPKT